MKKNVIKMAVAAVCVVAAGVSGMKAHDAAIQSEADMLLSENVEALSRGDENLVLWCIYSPGNICHFQKIHHLDARWNF